MSFLERTRAAVAAVLHVPEEQVRPQAALGELAPLDSLSLAEIASALDEEFGIRLPGDELSAARTVEELSRLAERSPRR